jgi:hypothetical protein
MVSVHQVIKISQLAACAKSIPEETLDQPLHPLPSCPSFSEAKAIRVPVFVFGGKEIPMSERAETAVHVSSSASSRASAYD